MNFQTASHRAIELAQTAPGVGGIRLAAVIFNNRSILAEGWNSLKTHPLQKKFSLSSYCFLHAEVAALAELKRKFPFDGMIPSNLNIVVVRLTKNGNLGLAKPCEICERALRFYNIKRVWYSTNEGTFTWVNHHIM